jgi:heptosyltransferase-2
MLVLDFPEPAGEVVIPDRHALGKERRQDQSEQKDPETVLVGTPKIAHAQETLNHKLDDSEVSKVRYRHYLPIDAEIREAQAKRRMIHADCRHFLGHKPCKYKRACGNCPHHDPVDASILVIKLGALGDLLRTTSILPSLKNQFPRARITWLTRPDCVPLLQNLGEIDRVWITDQFSTPRVLAEKFDLLINFDKETPSTELASIADARIKRGFGLSPSGSLIALNAGSEYALRLGIDDELKFRINTKTYQEIIHEMAELPVTLEGVPPYQLRLSPLEEAWGKNWFDTELGRSQKNPLVGINAGSGRAFATKKWHWDRYADVALRLYQKHGAIPVLFGGSDEMELNDKIHKRLRKKSVPVMRPGEGLSLRQFISLVSCCDYFITGDTLGMHVALAMGVKTLILFTSTCPQEIALYGNGKIIAGRADCSPCYLSECRQPSQYCADSIAAEDVYKTAVEHFGLLEQTESQSTAGKA